MAKGLNRLWRRRSGSVFAKRYFCRAIRRAREIKRALAYVLGNGRKHGVWRSTRAPDPFSSARWYSGWIEGAWNICRPLRSSPVATARDLVLTMPGFRSLSLVDLPGPRSWNADSAATLAVLLDS